MASNPRGNARSSKLKLEYWLEPDNLLVIEGWRRDGLTYKDISKKIGVDSATLKRWAQKEPELYDTLTRPADYVDYKIENALMKAALGYSTVESNVVLLYKFGKVVETRNETKTKQVAPNVTAIQTWLYNRCPDKWKKNTDGNIDLADLDDKIQITVTRAGNKLLDEEEDMNEEVTISNKHKKSKNE